LRQAKDPDSGLAGAVCPFSISSPSDSGSSNFQMLVGSRPSGQVNMTVLSGCSSAGSGLTRHLPAFYSVIEEIVEGFVEGYGERTR
jgi:hypothetical protein